nr:unnamed protein product [Callosobruchus chinensis]
MDRQTDRQTGSLTARRLAAAASLARDLVTISVWGLKNMVEPGSFKKSLIQAFMSQLHKKHDLARTGSSIAIAAGKKPGHLFRARKYFSPSDFLTLYKAQIRPSLEYCSHI